MPVSFATVDSQQMELTPMQVKFKAQGASDYVDLGGTLENIVVTFNYQKAEIKADQLGETVLDRRVSGLEIKVETALTEIKDKDIWKVVFPHATKVGGGSDAEIEFNSAVGDGDLSNAGELVLHPLSVASDVTAYDYVFYKACSAAESEITYSPTEQATLKIVWNVLPDTTQTPAKFAKFGDAGV
jgi:hypothetical protein